MVVLGDFEIPLCISTIGIWAGLTLLASETLEKKIDQNIRDLKSKLSKKGKSIGTRKIKQLNWPKETLKQASQFWAMSAILLGTDIVLGIQNIQITAFNSYDLFFYAGLLAIIAAGVYSYRIFEFVRDRNYHPTYGFSHLIKGFVLFLTSAFISITVIILFELYQLLAYLNLATQLLMASLVIGSLGASIIVYRLLRSGKISSLGVALLGSPAFYVIATAILYSFGITV